MWRKQPSEQRVRHESDENGESLTPKSPRTSGEKATLERGTNENFGPSAQWLLQTTSLMGLGQYIALGFFLFAKVFTEAGFLLVSVGLVAVVAAFGSVDIVHHGAEHVDPNSF